MDGSTTSPNISRGTASALLASSSRCRRPRIIVRRKNECQRLLPGLRHQLSGFGHPAKGLEWPLSACPAAANTHPVKRTPDKNGASEQKRGRQQVPQHRAVLACKLHAQLHG